MERQRRKIQESGDPNSSVYTEQGFTYLELTISLFILLVMIPAIFFCFITLVTESKKIMNEQRLQMEWISCYIRMQKELKKGKNFRISNESLVFDLPTGETIRYRWEKQKLVRDVKRDSIHSSFQGYTLLLHHVEAFRFVSDQSGVLIAFTLRDQNKTTFSVRTYIRGRTETDE